MQPGPAQARAGPSLSVHDGHRQPSRDDPYSDRGAVSWLPGPTRFAPSRPVADAQHPQGQWPHANRFPVTVAGQRRSLTVFPRRSHSGARGPLGRTGSSPRSLGIRFEQTIAQIQPLCKYLDRPRQHPDSGRWRQQAVGFLVRQRSAGVGETIGSSQARTPESGCCHRLLLRLLLGSGEKKSLPEEVRGASWGTEPFAHKSGSQQERGSVRAPVRSR